MSNIRVLHILHSMNAGGIESFLMNVYRRIDRQNVQFDFLLNSSHKGFFDDEIRSLGGRIFCIRHPYYPILNHGYNKELYNFFVRHPEYKIVHCHRNATSVHALRQAQKAGVPVRIAHSHMTNTRFTWRTFVYNWNKRFIKNYATHLFACSQSAGEWLFGKSGVQDSRFRVVNNGIDISRFTFNPDTRNDIRRALNIPDNFLIGHVGRFTAPKNHSFILDIFCQVKHLEPTAKLVLVGDGPLRKKMIQKCHRLGISDAVIFTGVQRNAEDYYQAMDVFLMPSLYEGLGIVAIEAQAMGLPVICSPAIPKDAKISDRIAFLDLKDSAVSWAKAIVAQKGAARSPSDNTCIKNNGFAIADVASSLADFYLRQWSTYTSDT